MGTIQNDQLRKLVKFIESYIMVQICSEITTGRVVNGEFYAHRLQKLNSSAFANMVLHENFSSIRGAKCSYISLQGLKRNLHETPC